MTTKPLNLKGLKEIIVRSLNLEGIRPDDIGDDDPLFGAGLGLDSVDALELVVALEKECGIRIQSHEVDPSAFRTAGRLHQFLEKRLAAGEGDPE